MKIAELVTEHRKLYEELAEAEGNEEELEQILEKVGKFMGKLRKAASETTLRKEYEWIRDRWRFWQRTRVWRGSPGSAEEPPTPVGDLKRRHEVPERFKELFSEETPEEEIEQARRITQKVFEKTGGEAPSPWQGLDLDDKAAVVYETAKEVLDDLKER